MCYRADAVERKGFNPDACNLAAPPLAEDPVKNTDRDPTAHANTGSLPVAQMLRQTALLAAVLDPLEHGIECMQAGQCNVVSLHGQKAGNPLVLGLDELHGWIFQIGHATCLLLLTSRKQLIDQTLRASVCTQPLGLSNTFTVCIGTS